ncbi:dolichyl-phosphate-mannose--protein mannosyltransferase [Malassezia equina]|uniref:Dolichyl-phosphate-mannose--protein mannosyltransferase n=1 Tax=Malassezia equina TaxID=1381935 RepID=A0AAF0EE17_9BASI|nr:dolichyl-phosphate-mannose--protein mannosyltransferase [Malassezia equina]
MEADGSELRRRPVAGATPAPTAVPTPAPAPKADVRVPPKPASTSWTWHGVLTTGLLGALALAVRLFQIGEPSQVVFDEVHFGKFAAYYVTRRYFFDVHPPLAKMLVALAAWFAGFDGQFEFENIGDSYIEPGVPYRQIRALSAVIGALQVPVVFQILRETGTSWWVAVAGAMAILVDNAHVLQTRLILLDAPLVLFVLLSLYSYIRFYQQRYRPFGLVWWAWLLATGVSLALTVSCKMVGVMTFATIGTAVILDLWDLLDIRRGLSLRVFVKHVCARALGLLIVPLFVYLGCFYVHFAILTKTGPGDVFMSPRFQQSLQGNDLLHHSMELHAFDTITLKHKKTGAFLHSHDKYYPRQYEDGRISSEGQQVTAYEHYDSNNLWKIVPLSPVDSDDGQFNKTRRRIFHGQKIRLLHVNTNSYLLTHDVAAPLMPTNEEFTTIPASELEEDEANTVFELQIFGGVANSTYWSSRRTLVRLIHQETRVALWTYKEGVLPEWASSQLEVNGNKNALDKSALWTVEDVHPDPDSPMYELRTRRPDRPRDPEPVRFLDKFVELQATMLDQNNRLTNDHPYASRPQSWPLVSDGVAYWSNNVGEKQIAFLPNLVSWWSAVLGLLTIGAIFTMDALFRRRGIYCIPFVVRQRCFRTTGFFVAAWAWHYLPFFLMHRQLFLHHYLPAHVCSVLAMASLVDDVTSSSMDLPLSPSGPFLRPGSLRPHMRRRPSLVTHVLSTVLILALAAMFVFMAPLTYGHVGLNADAVRARQWRSTWRMQFLQ